MISEAHKTAQEDLVKAIQGICLGSIEDVVIDAAIKALDENWEDACGYIDKEEEKDKSNNEIL